MEGAIERNKEASTAVTLGTVITDERASTLFVIMKMHEGKSEGGERKERASAIVRRCHPSFPGEIEPSRSS